ncbi:MAG: LuxR family transcriptional regulator [Kordiimonadaceae bacterium]|nr:LuxR family transcriptional regulator [Kordiimonadaceae bacterium]
MISLSQYFDLLENAKSEEGLHQATVLFLTKWRIEYFTLLTIGLDKSNAIRHPLGSFDHSWPLHYVRRNFRSRDAVLRHALSQDNDMRPVRWSDIAPSMSLEEATVLSEAKEHGLGDGIIFSILNANGSVTHFTVASAEFDVSEEDIAILEAAGKRLHFYHQKTLGNPERIKVPKLSARQNEILNLMDKQLSRAAIALELGISEETVKSHTAAIYSALKAMNIDHACFIGLRLTLLSGTPPTG